MWAADLMGRPSGLGLVRVGADPGRCPGLSGDGLSGRRGVHGRHLRLLPTTYDLLPSATARTELARRLAVAKTPADLRAACADHNSESCATSGHGIGKPATPGRPPAVPRRPGRGRRTPRHHPPAPGCRCRGLLGLKGRDSTAQGDALGEWAPMVVQPCKGAIRTGRRNGGVCRPFRACRDGVWRPRALPWAFE